MTTELEKRFFDMFGIEKQPVYSGSKLYNPFITGYEYPQITDCILLELICISTIYNNEPLDCKLAYPNIESLKTGVLEKILEAFTVYPIKVKRKVQELFKGE